MVSDCTSSMKIAESVLTTWYTYSSVKMDNGGGGCHVEAVNTNKYDSLMIVRLDVVSRVWCLTYGSFRLGDIPKEL